MVCAIDGDRGEGGVADDLALLLGDEGEGEMALLAQAGDDVRLRAVAMIGIGEGGGGEGCDGGVIGGRFRSDLHVVLFSRVGEEG